MKTVMFTLMQMDIVFGDPEANFRRVGELFAKGELREGEIVVLPELWNTAYDLERLPEIADVDGQATLALLSELAMQYKVVIIGGSIARKTGENFYNTTYIIDRNGKLLGSYDKLHLIPLMQEDKHFTSGNHLLRTAINNVSIGSAICYDMRFPELFRRMGLQGAGMEELQAPSKILSQRTANSPEIFILPAQWPKSRIEQWQILAQARAVENQAYFIALNRVGSDRKNVFNGHSLVVDPLGRIVAELGEEEEIRKVAVDMDLVEEVRRQMPCSMDRKPELY